MAELHRDGGGLESYRGPQYRKALLPWEQHFCETVGITAEDYFNFYELVAQQRQEEQGRELIPDIRNEATTVLLVASLVLSVGTAVYTLLQPKPRAPEQKGPGASFQGSDVRGRTKFSPLSEFSSVQDLATLGSVVPLIFTRRAAGHGGVRAESQMIWSKMINRPTYQELRTLLLFSAGDLYLRPDFEGYAFGDLKLEAYAAAKVKLWYSKGPTSKTNRPFANGNPAQYSEGTKRTGKEGTKPFYTDVPGDGKASKMIFCGVVTPSQSASFGQYSPIRNGQGWKYAFKYPGKGDGDKDLKKQIFGTRRKHVSGYHAGGTTLKKRGSSLAELKFRILPGESDTIYQFEDDDNTPSIGTDEHFKGDIGKLKVREKIDKGDGILEDIGGMSEGVNAINQSKVNADTVLTEGELYLLGVNIYRCTYRRNEGKGAVQGTPFEPGKSGAVYYHLNRENDYLKYYGDTNYFLVDDEDDVFNEEHIPVQKVALAAMSSTRAVDMVEIGIKSIVWRQVNGYPNINEFSGPDQVDDFAKNGGGYQLGSTVAYYDRVSLFRMEIRSPSLNSGKWFDWNKEEVFAVHGNNPIPQYNTIQAKFSKAVFCEFRFIPVCGNSWIANGNYKSKNVFLLNSEFDFKDIGTRGGIGLRIKGIKKKLPSLFEMSSPYFETGEKDSHQQNPNSLLQDFWYFDADTASHANEPEHKLTHLNEYVENDSSWYKNENKQYENLSYAGLVCQSSKDIGTFSNFSGYFKHGIEVERLIESGSTKRSTSNFPEIAYNLLTNRRYGVGEFIGNNAVDKSRMRTSAKFCAKNGLYWDGIIPSTVNVREFMFQQASYQLLDFTIIGGRFSLYPTVPFNTDYSIDLTAKAGDKNFPIKALLTDGNVRNFRCTFLSPEERQGFIAELKYREEETNGFPRTRVTRIRLNDKEGGYARDPVEAFDLSQFCTTRSHALKFAKFALRIRQTVDHSVSFETTPDAAHNLAPGDYIRVAVSIQHQETPTYFERLRTGSIGPDGTLQVNQGVGFNEKNVSAYYWRPGMPTVLKAKMSFTNQVVTDKAFYGCLFTRVQTNAQARVYKIESISFTDESFVGITASYVPLTSSGTMRLLDWSDKDFVIEDQN